MRKWTQKMYMKYIKTDKIKMKLLTKENFNEI